MIGIDKYVSAPPLANAANDASAVATLLQERFDFAPTNVHLLVSESATRDAILECFLSLACEGTGGNDRLLVFFAGHGHTVRSRRGEVGYLVPHDGDTGRLSSMIRWDDLTRNADLIAAKHVLFLMDACYGGLAITRALKPGSMRFLKDMLRRPARQVLTAGKADEVVTDAGGPLPGHSVFTGHLLEGLGGKAADADGLLTANGVMAYVYQMVGRDSGSRQTPHFGYLDGDGDFIFAAPALDRLQDDEKHEQDVLVSVPAVPANDANGGEVTVIGQVKGLLSEDRHRIRLHDLVAGEVRQALSSTSDAHFPLADPWSPAEFAGRLARYEAATANLCSIEALVGFWGTAAHREILVMPPKRLCTRLLLPAAGIEGWITLRWHPALLLLYCGGVGAIAAGRYDNLRALLQARVDNPETSLGRATLIRAVVMKASETANAFKTLPGHEQDYVPRSEYLFKRLQPMLDDLLFLGPDYETYFDIFEILLALEHAEEYVSEKGGSLSGPVGRFGWKFQRGGDRSPFHRLLLEAESQGASWPPVRAGLFRGSIDRFKEIAGEYGKKVSSQAWW